MAATRSTVIRNVMRRDALRPWLLLLSACLTQAQPVALSVNSTSREEVRQFYRTIFHASEGVPMEWTGNYAAALIGSCVLCVACGAASFAVRR